MAQRSGSEIQVFQGAPAPDCSFLHVTPPSTSTVPAATRKIYKKDIPKPHHNTLDSTSIVHPDFHRLRFARLNYPGQVQACGRGRQQADIRTQGHGCSVQGDEIPTSSDVQHQASDLDQVRPFPFSLGTSPYRARFTDACQYHTNWIDCIYQLYGK